MVRARKRSSDYAHSPVSQTGATGPGSGALSRLALCSDQCKKSRHSGGPTWGGQEGARTEKKPESCRFRKMECQQQTTSAGLFFFFLIKKLK